MMSDKKDYPFRFDDGLAIEVARSIRLFKKLIFLGSVSSVGIDIVKLAAADLLSSIAAHEQSLQHTYKGKA